MLRIAICDRNVQYKKQTEELWLHVCFGTEDISFTFYESGLSLTKALLDGQFEQDLLIIDPDLPDISGLRILELMKQQQTNTDIILQTEAAELALYGYRYRVFDFLRKPVSLQEAERVAERYLTERGRDAEGFLTVVIQGSRQRLRLGRIQFFESNVRKIVAVMETERVEFYQKMNELEKQLPPHTFIRCHQSYLVNRSYVWGMSAKKLLLLNQKRIPVSRRYMKDVQKMVQGRSQGDG